MKDTWKRTAAEDVGRPHRLGPACVFSFVVFALLLAFAASPLLALPDSAQLPDTHTVDTAMDAMGDESAGTSIDGTMAAAKGRTPSLLFFYAKWCGYCRKQMPIIDELEQEFSHDVTFARLDASHNAILMGQLSVTGFPTVVLVGDDGGRRPHYRKYAGFTQKDTLRSGIIDILGKGRPSGDSADVGIGLNIEGSSTPRNETGSLQAYVVPYVGDIDGSIDANWHHFYRQLLEWHEENGVPAGFSFYPGTMDDSECTRIVADMHSSECVELILKGESEFNGVPLDRMSKAEAKAALEFWMNRFQTKMEGLGYLDAKGLVTYNQRLGRFTLEIRDALRDLGFRMYFEQFVTEYGYVEPLPDFDVTQYAVALTTSGRPGADEIFKQPDAVIKELLDFDHERQLLVNGTKVVPLLVHQQDFRTAATSATVDQVKWARYTSLLLKMQGDVRIRLLRPDQVYDLRHDLICGNGIRGNAEECDDGNLVDGDGCTGECRVEERSVTCGNGVMEGNEECDDGNLENGDGCSAVCGQERIVLLAMDDLQSQYLEDIQRYVVQEHVDKGIPVTLGVIPGRLGEPLLTNIRIWDKDPLVEVAQHDYTHDTVLIGKDYDFQYDYLKAGRDLLNSWGIFPKSMVPASGQADDTTIQVAGALGFDTVYEGMPLNVASREDPRTIADQLHLCVDNAYGVDCTFKEYGALRAEIESKLHEDGVALVMYHMQDFAASGGAVAGDRVRAYFDLVDNLIRDGFVLMTVEQYHRYKVEGRPVAICQYATSARATSEHESAPAEYAVGVPNAPRGSSCSGWEEWSGHGYTWSPQSWDVKAQLTLTYATPVYASRITIFGDHDICWAKILMENSATGEREVAFEGTEGSCTFTCDVSPHFLVDTVVLETCGWSWSASDAVRLCGHMPCAPACGNRIVDAGEECDDGNVEGRDGCDSNCALEGPVVTCGNGILEQGEECDDGNDLNGDGCSIDCLLDEVVVCGNGTLEAAEECDDGNALSGDGCSRNCISEPRRGTVCQYAISAEAQSESTGSEAMYATGGPDTEGICTTESSANASWSKGDWRIPAEIDLTFADPVYPRGITIYGDYELCISRVWLWRDGAWYPAWRGDGDKGGGSSCTLRLDFSLLDFKTNRLKLDTCDYRWSAIDAVKLCGTYDSHAEISIVSPVQDAIVDSHQGSVNVMVSTDRTAECAYGYTRDFTFSDGMKLSTVDGTSHSYELAVPILAQDATVYYKCRDANNVVNPYGVVHRMRFASAGEAFVEVCDWYDCAQGAASVTVDDGYHTTIGQVKTTCKDELEKNGLKGTYYLAYTDLYTDADWTTWREMSDYGHEIGGHMGNCSYGRSEGEYTRDLEDNKQDIAENLGVRQGNLITFAWPCGVVTPEYREWASDYYLFQRGYHINEIESESPEDFQNIKSINSVGFGENPPDYYSLADLAENHQDWVVYAYHDYCDNSGVIDYLLTKDLWVETVGTVSKYIVQRNSVRMQDVRNTIQGVFFRLATDLDPDVFDVDLTLRVCLGSGTARSIKVNGDDTEFRQFTLGGQEYIRFNVPSSQMSEIEISGLKVSVPYCGDGLLNQACEECDDGNQLDFDGCSDHCVTEEPQSLILLLRHLLSGIFARCEVMLAPFWGGP